MDEVIDKFLENKKISDPLIRDTVRGFIVRHDELFGDFIPFEDFMMRLNENLNAIVMHDPSEGNVVGQYVGFDENNVNMYFEASSLANSQLAEDFKSILIHELTHCAYNIKNHDIYNSETQVFARIEKYGEKVDVTGGTDKFIEPIINYISTSIDGRQTGAYVAQTASMSQLAGIIGNEAIVKNAFYSDQVSFKAAMDTISPGAYEYFEKGLSYFNNNLYNYGKEIMDNFFMNKIPEQKPAFQSLDPGINNRRLGYIHVFGLIVFLIIIVFILIVAGTLLIDNV